MIEKSDFFIGVSPAMEILFEKQTLLEAKAEAESIIQMGLANKVIILPAILSFEVSE